MIALVAIGLVLRLGWALTRPVDPAAIEQLPDQREYLEAAQNLLHGEGLCFRDPRFNDRVYAYRTPGYPAILAACGAEIRIARILQCLLDSSAIIAVFLLARPWIDDKSALIASLLVAFNPFLIYFCGLLLSETAFTALLIWGMLLVTSRRTLLWLVGGTFLALSILVRPGAMALPVVLGVIGAMVTRPMQRRWPLPVGTTMVLLTVATLLPWAYRNSRAVGEWVWTSTNGGITAYDGFNPDATGASDQRFVATMPQLKGMSEVARDTYLREKAEEFIRADPGRAAKLAMAKVVRTWSPVPLSSEFSRPAYVAVALVFALPFDVLVLMGLLGGGLPRAAKVFLTAPAVYLTLTVMASVGSLRYRIPAEVPLAVLAASALERRSRSPDEKDLHSTTDVETTVSIP